MATVEQEINSFISKFAQLCVCGVNASLNFTNSNGSISANLHADIGSMYCASKLSSNRKKYSSSRSRRRKRCQNEKSETDKSIVTREWDEIKDSSASDEDPDPTSIVMFETYNAQPPLPLDAVLMPFQMDTDQSPSTYYRIWGWSLGTTY